MNEKVNEIMSNNEGVNPENSRFEQIVFGWNSVNKAAEDINSGMHSSLLKGYPVFLFNNTSSKSDLVQVVVVRNWNPNGTMSNNYGVGIITAGWSALYPHMPVEYLESDLLDDLKKYKVDSKIVNIYIQIIKNLKDEQ